MSTLERYFEANLGFMRKRGLSNVTGERCAIDDAALSMNPYSGMT